MKEVPIEHSKYWMKDYKEGMIIVLKPHRVKLKIKGKHKNDTLSKYFRVRYFDMIEKKGQE